MVPKLLLKRCIEKALFASPMIRSFSNITPIQMAYTLYGENNSSHLPLIIMHGLFGSQRNWKTVARTLESKVDKMIFTVDARNHGDSPHTSEHSSAHMAADISELMKSKGITKACAMGHSMGGRTMMHLALKHPELVDRAIIIDISPIAVPRDFHQMDEIFKAMENVDIPAKYSLGQGRKIAEDQIKKAVGVQATVEFILMNLRKRNTGEFYWVPNIGTLHKNLRLFNDFQEHVKDLPPFRGPVMFICGNQSNFVDPNTWPDIQKMFPNSELHWLDAGHLVHFDQPEMFVNLVMDFLRR
ncbi:protein ABHD11 isoform X1 [Bactrocera dorsalis]|uniref:sn-1-specific diacylglycerol lipase ABHD11 n=1 Tax=Bactrocera dorsalis TaxID=27457 RepID=A0ABM3JN70_BACDO|nr:protein ABHD11 isoform X1 [Bactrocera dorsalis]